jgi:hypothetical protein
MILFAQDFAGSSGVIEKTCVHMTGMVRNFLLDEC